MKKKFLLLPLVVALVGTAIWLFMITLSASIEFFQAHWMYLIAALPLISLAYAYVDHFRKMHRLGNTETLIEEIRFPQKHVHWLLAPWIFAFTIVFHFFGASVGRESTAVQVGASLAETLGRLFRIPVEDRPILLRMGFAAGFGAAFGVPWAGTIFALESPLLKRKRDWLHLPFYLLASFGADRWARLLGLEHPLWQSLDVSVFQVGSGSYWALTGFLIVLALTYEVIFRNTVKALKKSPWWLRSGAAGLLIAILTLWIGEPIFNNLGTNWIASSFAKAANLDTALMKLMFTWISTASGMKGGEVTPLMSAGSLFGSWFASEMPHLNFQLGAALGLVTLFTSRLRIPLAGILMLWELFDWRIALLGAPTLLLIEYGHRKLVSKFS
jgi:H+/Cl- antiporter ClcA